MQFSDIIVDGQKKNELCIAIAPCAEERFVENTKRKG